MIAAYSALVAFLQSIFKWLLDGVLFVLKSVLFFIFDGVLTAIQAIFTAIDVGSFAVNYAAHWSSLPPQMLYFVNAIGIPQCVVMLASAMGIRMLINLIPAEFTRV